MLLRRHTVFRNGEILLSSFHFRVSRIRYARARIIASPSSPRGSKKWHQLDIRVSRKTCQQCARRSGLLIVTSHAGLSRPVRTSQSVYAQPLLPVCSRADFPKPLKIPWRIGTGIMPRTDRVSLIRIGIFKNQLVDDTQESEHSLSGSRSAQPASHIQDRLENVYPNSSLILSPDCVDP